MLIFYVNGFVRTHISNMLRYLAYILDDQNEGLKIGDIYIVRDFSDVFPEDFLS